MYLINKIIQKSDSNLTIYMLLAGLFFLLCVALVLGNSFWFYRELMYYYEIASFYFTYGKAPYIGFGLEHPPGAFFYFFILYLLSLNYFPFVYMLSNWTLSFVVFARYTLFSFQKLTHLFIVALLSPYTLFRYDMLPSICSYLSYRQLLQKKNFIAGIFLGLGIITKVYPLFLFPLFSIFLIHDGINGKNLKRILNLSVGTALAALIPFFGLLLFDKAGILQATVSDIYEYHFSRGVQVESLWAGPFLLPHLDNFRALMELSFGSWNVINYPTVIVQIIPAIEMMAVGLVYVLFFMRLRRSNSEDKDKLLLGYSLLVLWLIIILNKVLSPQYMLWAAFFMLEFDALYSGSKHKIFMPTFLYILILMATFAIISNYGFLLLGNPLVLAAINIRNLLLLALLYSIISVLRKQKHI